MYIYGNPPLQASEMRSVFFVSLVLYAVLGAAALVQKQQAALSREVRRVYYVLISRS
jgi:hypothetical protein